MSRAIAEHMVRSKATAPHVTSMIEVDVTEIVRYREAHRAAFQERNAVPLSYVPFVIKAAIAGLRAHPWLNSTWRDEGVVLRKEINVGVAVAVEAGLIVPVIHQADGKSFTALASAVADLAERARAGKLTLEDVQGGTFTVNNPGAFGSVWSMPIINQPQAAILSMEAIVKRPVVVGPQDAIAVRSIMNLCMSFDHRILDGLMAARFMQEVRHQLEGFTEQMVD
jgi:2-oxoisovalerate dehydrogenase E2 component (dihydrolipoyl transacylase)